MSSLDHSLNADITFKPGVSLSQLIAAFQPIANYLGWKPDNIAMNDLYGEDELKIEYNDDGTLSSVSLYTSGTVGQSFSGLVYEVARNLRDIAVAGYFTFKNYDDPNLEKAISRIWFGTDDEVDVARRAQTWLDCVHLLKDAGIADATIQKMAQAGQFIHV